MILTDWIHELRRLEAATAAHPGYESDHEHQASPAYEEYDAFFGRLPSLVNAAPLPQAWLALESWCGNNSFWFGDAVLPGAHKTPMRWAAQERSLRHALLLCILWRAQERLTRPEDDGLWTHPKTGALLARASTWEECGKLSPGQLWCGLPSLGLFRYPDPVANILALLGERGEELLATIASPRTRQQYAALAAKHAAFTPGNVTFSKTPDGRKLAAQFAQSQPEGDNLYIALADRESHEPHPLLVIPMRMDEGRLRDIHEDSRLKDPMTTTVQVHPDSASIATAETCFTQPAWPPPWNHANAPRTLCAQIRGSGPWYFVPLRNL